jgi:hypothetical protein
MYFVYVSGERAFAGAYEMLSGLSLQLLSDGCCGVFLPKEEAFMPNDGTVKEGLQLGAKPFLKTTGANHRAFRAQCFAGKPEVILPNIPKVGRTSWKRGFQ